MSKTMLTAARAEALFVSHAQPSQTLTRDQATQVISAAICAHNGLRGCACDVAAEFARHPETAIPRMRWALATADALFTRPTRTSMPVHARRNLVGTR
jgi:hypothetical protein